MSDTSVFDQPLVFGLDIGTRNVVGTVGYKTENEFVVVAQYMLEHETRAMLGRSDSRYRTRGAYHCQGEGGAGVTDRARN